MSSLHTLASVVPRSIISGDLIRGFDFTIGTGEVPITIYEYMNEYRIFVATNGQVNIYRAAGVTEYQVGDCVVINNPPTPFTAVTTYWVVYNITNYIRLSATMGGSPITPTSDAGNMWIYPGTALYPYASLRPLAVGSNTEKAIVYTSVGSNGGGESFTPYFLMIASPLAKPSISGIYQDISIFIYNTVSATVLNRNRSANNHLFFQELKFTNLLSKIGTAKFSVVNPGDATSTELDLLLAGSDANTQKDNYVAIIQGKAVVWSGKITRSIQNKTGIFDSPLVQTWDIDCESDVVKMKYQEVLPANMGYKRKQVGFIVYDLLTKNKSTDIDWNGYYELAIRTSEGVIIDYYINDSDMFTQFMILAKTSNFDWRTRLTYFRATYSRSGSVFTPTNGMNYTANSLIGFWMVVASPGGGLISFGKITSNTTTTITCTMTNTPAASGTLLVLQDPILDFAGTLATPSKVQTYRMNANPWTGGNGYGFNDKTDRTQLATKVTAKAKNEKGITITTSSAAVQPWDRRLEMFDNSSYITKRTEGRILQFTPGALPYGQGTIVIEGWGYETVSTDYYNLYKKDGTRLTLLQYRNVGTATEIMYGGQRATTWAADGYLNSVGDALTGGICQIINANDIGADAGGTPKQYPNPSQRFFFQSPCGLSPAAGDNFYFNGEIIDITSVGTDTIYGKYILFLANSSAEHRVGTDPYFEAHPNGTIMWKESAYNEANPATGSPLYYHGSILQTFMTDVSITLGELHKILTTKLIAHSNYARKATFWCMFDNWWKTGARVIEEEVYQEPPEVGDSIMCLQDDGATEADLIYGQLKNMWKIVGWSLNTEDMMVEVELGDYEKNLFSVMSDKTASLLLTKN